jgi:hypothetical protein
VIDGFAGLDALIHATKQSGASSDAPFVRHCQQ